MVKDGDECGLRGNDKDENDVRVSDLDESDMWVSDRDESDVRVRDRDGRDVRVNVIVMRVMWEWISEDSDVTLNKWWRWHNSEEVWWKWMIVMNVMRVSDSDDPDEINDEYEAC